MEEVKSEHYKPNHNLVNLIVTLATVTCERVENSKPSEVIYLTTKSVLFNKAIRPTSSSVIPAVFSYYLEAYCKYHEGLENTPPKGQLFNEAALALLDMYVASPGDNTLRRLVPMVSNAVRDVSVDVLSLNKDLELKVSMNRLSNLALIAETTSFYTKASRQMRNIPYIKWLREFFSKVLKSTDLAFMEEDEEFKKIIPQLANGNTFIAV
jgi:hypothetical protein